MRVLALIVREIVRAEGNKSDNISSQLTIHVKVVSVMLNPLQTSYLLLSVCE